MLQTYPYRTLPMLDTIMPVGLVSDDILSASTNTLALNAAVAEWLINPRPISLPAGKFWWADPIKFHEEHAGIEIIGKGAATILLRHVITEGYLVRAYPLKISYFNPIDYTSGNTYFDITDLTYAALADFAVGDACMLLEEANFANERTFTKIFIVASTSGTNRVHTTEAITDNVASITHVVLTGNRATYTTSAPHGFQVSSLVTVTGLSAPYNGAFGILTNGIPTPTTFEVDITHADIAGADVSGTATVKHRSVRYMKGSRVATTAVPSGTSSLTLDVTDGATTAARYSPGSQVYITDGAYCAEMYGEFVLIRETPTVNMDGSVTINFTAPVVRSYGATGPVAVVPGPWPSVVLKNLTFGGSDYAGEDSMLGYNLCVDCVLDGLKSVVADPAAYPHGFSIANCVGTILLNSDFGTGFQFSSSKGTTAYNTSFRDIGAEEADLGCIFTSCRVAGKLFNTTGATSFDFNHTLFYDLTSGWNDLRGGGHKLAHCEIQGTQGLGIGGGGCHFIDVRSDTAGLFIGVYDSVHDAHYGEPYSVEDIKVPDGYLYLGTGTTGRVGGTPYSMVGGYPALWQFEVTSADGSIPPVPPATFVAASVSVAAPVLSAAGGLDDFAETTSVSLASHTAQAGSWTVSLGTIAVLSGKATVTALSGGEYRALMDCLAADGRLTPTVSLASNSSYIDVIFRYTNASNFWFLRLGGSTSADPGLKIYRYEAASYTIEAVEAIAVASGEHDVQIIFVDTAISTTFDGAHALSCTNEFNKTATICGIKGVATGDYLKNWLFAAAYLQGDGSGVVPASTLIGILPNATFPVTLPAVSAANLTAVPAANLSGVVPRANLPARPGYCGLALTTDPDSPVSTADRTAQDKLYLLPDGDCCVSLYYGSAWVEYVVPKIGFVLSGLTNNKIYDTFLFPTTATPSATNTSTDVITFASAQGWATGAAVSVSATGGGLTAGTAYYWNAASSTTGTFHTTLANAFAGTSKIDLTASITAAVTGVSVELSAAWTNDTTQADATDKDKDGVETKTADHSRLYVGSFRSTSTTTTEQSALKQFVFNNKPHRTRRPLRVKETTASWTPATSWQQVRASAANQVAVLIGRAGPLVSLKALEVFSGGGSVLCIGIGEDSAAAPAAECLIGQVDYPGATVSPTALLEKTPTAGYHYYTWMEYSSAATTAYGEDGTPVRRPGLTGWVEC